jgi:Delta7-sterol 5-desaturase
LILVVRAAMIALVEALHTASPSTIALLVFAFFATLTVTNVAIGFWVEHLYARYKIFDLPLARGQYRFELIGNVVFLAVTTLAFTAVLSAKVVHFAPETFFRGAATFLALMIGFQAYYWVLHRAMHTKALIRFHSWHHRSHVTTPLSGQSMSFVESCGWMIGYVGLPLVFSMIEPISLWGWASYMVFNVSGNIVGHSNVELGARLHATRVSALFSNPLVYHCLHHARWRGHYSFQAAFMDRLLGTEFEDWPALYAKVSSGRPLQSLKETGSSQHAHS